ncbi:hypothetical protein [Streptomyces sp. H34-S4]|uniref:hypothetical protein n=1 Tax=Streptomyces sp. H34-S4 TaxID=2996463 RepID=UPI002270561E|nr:hypothetical protein [Streptomyces sp. H34-S4]MCY0938156.1 hypothetical protein [Streptomyces sp. H34-S4]
MKLSKRIVATSAAVLLGTLALGGAAQAADSGGGAADRASSPSRTIEAPKGTPHVPAKKVRPASKENTYSQTIEAPAGTEYIGAGVAADK